MRRKVRVVAALAMLGLLAAPACGGGTEVYSVRGQVVGLADGGRSLVVDHEAVPGRMAAMRMTLALQDPARAEGLASGDTIRFELYVSRGRGSVGGIERLPADTELALAAPPADE